MDESRLVGLPKPGELIAGKYRIQRLIGFGGMGAVFVAQHEMLAKEIALKLLLADAMNDAASSTRFVNEARAAAKIKGDHVVGVHDVGVLDDGRPYIAMDLLEGEDLGLLLQKGGPLPHTTVVDYLLQGMEALAQAHAHGIVHRDLKPSNFFLATQADGSRVVKVLDFGIAKTIGANASVSLTNTKAMMGSPLYMSPEQIRRSKDVDPQSDVWALGVVAFELLTGQTPFLGENIGEVVLAIAEQTPARADTLRPGIPAALGVVVARCLEKDRTRRFKTVVELARALAPFASRSGVAEVERVAAAFERVGARSTGDVVLALSPRPPITGDASAPPGLAEAMTVRGDTVSPTQGSWTHHGDARSDARSRRRYILKIVGIGAAVGLVAGLVMFGVMTFKQPSPPPTLATAPDRPVSLAPADSVAAAAPAWPGAGAGPAASSAPSASPPASAAPPVAPPRATGQVLTRPRPPSAHPLKTDPQSTPTTPPKDAVPKDGLTKDGLMKKDAF